MKPLKKGGERQRDRESETETERQRERGAKTIQL